jgi:signal peptidase II
MTVGDAAGARGLRWLWLALAVIVADQVTKTLIVRSFELYEVLEVWPVLEITRLHNTGAAFSLLAGASGWQRWFFVGLAVVVSVGIVYWLWRMPRTAPFWLPAGLSLVMGGALGNVIDRLLHGHVVDFLHFHWERWYFPAFNLADTAITIGAGLLILDALLEGRRSQARSEAS